MNEKTVVTRFAPSPTGYFHAGSYRTALFAYIFARQNTGKFILRIEDTDKERSKKEYEENIVESLKWLGLDFDEFYRQSERTEIYREYINKLIDLGHAYVSKEENREGQVKSSRQEVIRFKNPKIKVAFDDIIRGRIEFDTTELGDFVIAKSMDEPVFHLVVVIDDHTMGVTHVIRGEDHISNTPRQILIYKALGVEPPFYAHIPLLLSADRSKLSKRHGAVPVSEYRAKGFIPQALVNYFALLGWHPKDDREVIDFQDIIEEFSLERVQKSGAIFDEEKLKWFNREYIKKLADKDFTDLALTFLPEWLSVTNPLYARLLPVLKDKIASFGDIADLFTKNGELSFIKTEHEIKADMLLWKKNPDAGQARTHLMHAMEKMEDIDDADFTADNIRTAIWPYAEEHGKGDVLWPLRMALTRQDKSPDPFISAYILGKDESLKRIQKACALLSS